MDYLSADYIVVVDNNIDKIPYKQQMLDILSSTSLYHCMSRCHCLILRMHHKQTKYTNLQERMANKKHLVSLLMQLYLVL